MKKDTEIPQEKEVIIEEQLQIAGQNLLVGADKYLKSGAHIGTRFKSGDMKKYIYKMRPDGLSVLDVQTLDERIRIAAQFIARIPAEKIAVVARRLYGKTPSERFAEAIGARAFTSRFVPGTFTNANHTDFFEPRLIIATEPESDSQSISEAGRTKAIVIGICSTNNSTKNIDLVVPANNKGRKSLALVYWLLAREVLKAKELITKDEQFDKKIEDFEYKLTEDDIKAEQEAAEAKQSRFGRGRFGRGRSFGSSSSRPRPSFSKPGE
ncbi:MAG: 30S ribosomal protein S2 [Candidatus Diapherotrites archaeon]|nr:30S ribosomal protein S2 [Candidatus Diapherotrites archaeon]